MGSTSWLIAVVTVCIAHGCASPPPRAPFRGAIEVLSRKLEEKYVFPEQGRRYASMLRDQLARGAYRDVADGSRIAQRLTEDLQALAPDPHLAVWHAPHARASRPARKPDSSAIEDARWIADRVAYIRFRAFPGDPATLAATAAFMNEHATAKALVIDAREHHGGGPLEMDVMLPYLYPEETTLIAMEAVERVVRDMGGLPYAGPSMRVVPGSPGMFRRLHVVTPHPTEHRLFAAQLYYLTSPRTESAAEHLALALQRTHRAVLIGETTAGANHFGDIESLGADLGAFIPIGRAFDPDTGRDWEGRGITPDIAVPAETALDEALRQIQARALR